mmetsp:Transcript_4507/g.6297  ORF Transcript_4507/g.6297 Transcript_4507/m.6297 type:complete len:256 (+) Transcript_4507:64-831(+)|eukprot:CAMPEP_0168557262 /NCGR_PEP_ID=MMETSP0413-20121227/9332_1 /TAXON_ID=136452 /ORGANISM="Filamoeba nolandi, Strain NC-AS-23-1" /LENGTH=255 /DNA_ID=CAMNT_0008588283 /DNA_START=56 /DNA_END=823 /DNA_ORIENTATION=-
MSYVPAHPTPSYVPLATTVPIEEEGVLPQPTACEAKKMCRASKWVVFLAVFQLMWSIFALLGGAVLLFAITLVFTTMGLHGVRRQSPKLLTAHFVFSLFLYFFSVIGLVLLVMYGNDVNVWVFVSFFVVILIQAVGIRHSRILISLTKKYSPNGVLPTSRRCCQGNSCTVQTQTNEVPLQPVEIQPPTAPQVAPPAYPQQFFAVVPPQGAAPGYGFYPMPPVIRYPVMPQGIQVVPPYMQPAETSNLYPGEQKEI